MTREDAITFCRYYKGEDESPYSDQNESMLWFYERAWVYKLFHEDTDSFGIMLEEYLFSGLSDFEKFDDIPITLKALLFNRYCKTAQSMLSAVEPFKKFYHKYYTDHQ